MKRAKALPLLFVTLLSSVTLAQVPTITTSSQPYQPLTGATTIAYTMGDDEGVLVPLGFSFPYFGQSYTHVMINSNGILVLGGPTTPTCATGCLNNQILPSAGSPAPSIAPFWDDLQAAPSGAGSVRYVAGAGGFTVEFVAVQRYANAGATITFQVHIDPSGQFSVHYGSMTGPATSWNGSAGFEDGTTTQGASLLGSCGTSCNTNDVVANRLVTVGTPLQAELIVTSVTTSGLTTDVNGNLHFTVSARLQNLGRTDANNFSWRALLSRDQVLDGTDIPVATGTNVSLAGATALASVLDVSALAATTNPPTPGEYFVLVEVDPTHVVPEALETNNVGVSATSFAQGLDLLAGSVSGPANSSPASPETVVIGMTNRSMTTSASFGFRVLLSTDTTLDASDVPVATGTRTLAAGQTSSESIATLTPSTLAARAYFYLLQLDPTNALAEVNELNNVVASSTAVTVARGDLEATQVTLLDLNSQPISAARFGSTVKAVVRVRNNGAGSLSNFTVALLLSRDANFSVLSDSYVCDQLVPLLAPNTSTDVTLTCALPLTDPSNVPFTRASYFLMGLVDSLGAIAESNEVNNGVALGPLPFDAPGPDLAISSLDSVATTGAGETIPVTRTLSNRGDVGAGPATYRYFASTDATVTAADLPLQLSISGLAALERTVNLAAGSIDADTDLVVLPPSLTPGPWFIGCIVDFGASVREADETNNALGTPLTVLSSGLSIATTQPPDGIVGRPYGYQLVAQGATGPLTWSLVSGEGDLPAGLTLDAGGAIAGTPTGDGVTQFTVTVNEGTRQATARVALRIRPALGALEITTTIAPPVMSDPSLRYELALGVTGGTAPYAWRVVSGTLPGLLTCSTGGVVSGVMPAGLPDSSTRVTFEVSDAQGSLARRELVFRVVAPGALKLTTEASADARLGVEFLQYLHATNGDGTPVLLPLLWSVSEGALPEGVTLVTSPTAAQLSGTPTRVGLFDFAITVEDAIGRRASAWVSLRVQPAALSLRSTDLPASVKPGQAVSFHLEAPGAEGPTFTLVSGELPAGVTLAGDGTVSGTVAATQAEATFAFVVEAVDVSGSRGLAAFGLVVRRPAAGCSSVGGGSGWGVVAVMVLALASLRRRRASALAAALVLCAAPAARAQYEVVGPSPTTYQPLTSGTVVTTGSSLSIPFSMPFFDTPFTSVAMSQFGYLAISGSYLFTSTNQIIPNTSTSAFVPQRYLAPWWDSLNVAASYRMQVSGVAPHRVASFEWAQAGTTLATNRVSFQVQLYETGRIRFVYDTPLPSGSSASVGLQKDVALGVPALTCSNSGACLAADFPAGQAIDFFPPNDLVMTGLTAPPVAYAGSALPARARVANAGGRDLTGVVVRFFLSSDAVLDGSDVVVGDLTTDVPAGNEVELVSTAVLPANTSLGQKFLFARVDPNLAITEAVETNNTSAAVVLTIAAPIGDLSPVSVASPAQSPPGGMVQVSGVIHNGGTAAMATSKVTWFLSTNAAITLSDRPLATGTLAALAVQSDDTVSATLTIPADVVAGVYWLGLCVNSDLAASPPFPLGESSVVNNCLAAITPLRVTTMAPSITTTMVPPATLSAPYGVRLRATGGDGTFTWSVSTGALPAGLELTSTGELRGTPLELGSFTFDVQATSGPETATATLHLVVDSVRTLAVLDVTLVPASVGRNYEVDVLAVGGLPPYSWVVTAGALPAGLSLSAAGVLSGRPLAAGDFTATIGVTDSRSAHATKELSLRVFSETSLHLATPGLTDATLDVPYRQPLDAAGGQAPYVVTLVQVQALPLGPTDAPGPVGPAATLNGLTVAANALTGTPTTPGLYSLTLSLSDARGDTVVLERELRVVADPIEITTSTLPDAVVGEAYAAQLEAVGSGLEFTVPCARAAPDFACIAPPPSAQLPAGLVLAKDGSISGTPTATGLTTSQTSTFLIKVVDARARQGLRAMALTVKTTRQTSGCSSVGLAPLGFLVLLTLTRRRHRGATRKARRDA